MTVLERRSRVQPDVLPPPDSDLTPPEFSSYRRQLAKGELMAEQGRDFTKGEGSQKQVIVGQKICLPNVMFRAARNHTPKGKPYNPYEATFRVPQSITKTDIRPYLSAVYGVKTTYIRTANYISPLRRTRMGLRPVRRYRTYKRAVVGLVDPFYYPLDMEDMDKVARREREAWLEKFTLKALVRWRRYELVRTTQSGSKGWRFTGHLRRDKILQAFARRRMITRMEIEGINAEIAGKRAVEKQILMEKVKS
ncbi:hypothetical protein EDD17DRAFT_1751975 [Pisolithus thermaeus]|nr:hypothetical protein EDD17DRAFT_1751975 [Pisolithus thermaeus]